MYDIIDTNFKKVAVNNKVKIEITKKNLPKYMIIFFKNNTTTYFDMIFYKFDTEIFKNNNQIGFSTVMISNYLLKETELENFTLRNKNMELVLFVNNLIYASIPIDKNSYNNIKDVIIEIISSIDNSFNKSDNQNYYNTSIYSKPLMPLNNNPYNNIHLTSLRGLRQNNYDNKMFNENPELQTWSQFKIPKDSLWRVDMNKI